MGATTASTSAEFELAKPADGFTSEKTSVSADVNRFRRWLIAALAVHVCLLTGLISTSHPRQIGDASGMDDAISVSLVSEADLKGKSTVEDHAAGEPVPPPQLAEPKPPQPAPPPEPEQTEQQQPEQQQPEPETKAAEPVKPEPEESKSEAETAPDREADKEATASIAPPNELRDSLPPDPGADEAKADKSEPAAPPPPKKEAEETPKKEKAKKAEPKPTPKPKKTKTANLDLSIPRAFSPPPGSRGAGFERPAGITRSGANDDFARGVIRALQATMPQLSNTRGRVRVRITLNRNGNLVSTNVEMPSNVAGLDQSVVFATRQTSFPLPPYNAVPADLVFIVTYIYE
ncbi:MAG: energy transducer TonB [Hyphomicrobium sp.]